MDVTKDGKILISGGRDKIVNIWDLERGVLKKTMPVFETLESVGLVEVSGEGSGKGKGKESDKQTLIFTGGDKGIVRLWDMISGEAVVGNSLVKNSSTGKTHEITDLM